MLLKEGDIIEIKNGHKVYSTVPKHFLYSNCKGDFTLGHGECEIGGELSYLAGNYVVDKVKFEGGGFGHGSHDIYPDGHHVFCKSLTSEQEVDFYQTGCFTCMITDIQPIGKAEISWKIAETFKENK